MFQHFKTWPDFLGLYFFICCFLHLPSSKVLMKAVTGLLRAQLPGVESPSSDRIGPRVRNGWLNELTIPGTRGTILYQAQIQYRTKQGRARFQSDRTKIRPTWGFPMSQIRNVHIARNFRGNQTWPVPWDGGVAHMARCVSLSPA